MHQTYNPNQLQIVKMGTTIRYYEIRFRKLTSDEV